MKISANKELKNASPAQQEPKSSLRANGFSLRTPHSTIRIQSAFSLLELLVVIVIIGLLASVGLPAIRGMTKSNAMAAANRQLLDDLSFARQRAIAEHTTVYMIFIPPYIKNTYTPLFDPSGTLQKLLTDKEKAVVTNLWGGQCTTYALVCLRTVGDQPGTSTARYLTGWRTLPNGVFIATNKFANYFSSNPDEYSRAFPQDNTTRFPYPMVNSKGIGVTGIPYIGFNHLGQLITPNNQSEVIPLARGSIFPVRDASGNLQGLLSDIAETPPGNSYYDPTSLATPPPGPTNTQFNIIYIDWLTGKARIQKAEIQ